MISHFMLFFRVIIQSDSRPRHISGFFFDGEDEVRRSIPYFCFVLNSAVSVVKRNSCNSLIPGTEGRGNKDVDVGAWAEIQDAKLNMISDIWASTNSANRQFG